jgi:S1-C subfamily serine protease
MRVPDWLIYTTVLATILFVLFSRAEDADAPEAPPPSTLPPISDLPPGMDVRPAPVPDVPADPPPDEVPQADAGPVPLPAPSERDPVVMVSVGPVESGIGTAFAVDTDGWWLTARHVVDSCDRVGIMVAGNSAAPVTEVRVAEFADLALLRTPGAPDALQVVAADDTLFLQQKGFHIGFPQGRPGEASSRLLGRQTLVARGRYNLDEPVVAWAETGRTRGIDGSLSGLSGGPVFDEAGRVVGVTVAESARRGRIFTASPESLVRLMDEAGVRADGAPAGRLTVQNYGPVGDRLRRELAVAKVICVAGPQS